MSVAEIETPVVCDRAVRTPGPIVIEIEGVTKVYEVGSETIHALRGVSLKIRRNEYLAIMGPSGSGKSTMMNMLGCLDTPTEGKYDFNGKDVKTMDDDELAAIRNHEIGFVFQTFNLLPRSTSLSNVELPLIYAGIPSVKRRAKARQALENVGLGNRMDHRPNELSGGRGSAWRLRARWLTIRPSSWPTSRRAISTARPAARSWRSSRTSTRKGTRSSS